MHHQRRLHRHGGAVAAVYPLDLARDQAVADIADAGAAIAVDGGAEQAQLAHFGHDLAVEMLVPVRLQHTGHQLVLGIGAGAVAHHALVFGKLILQQQRIFPLEPGGGPFTAGFLRLFPASFSPVVAIGLAVIPVSPTFHSLGRQYLTSRRGIVCHDEQFTELKGSRHYSPWGTATHPAWFDPGFDPGR